VITHTRYSLADHIWVRLDHGKTMIYDSHQKRIFKAGVLMGNILDSIRLEPRTEYEIATAIVERLGLVENAGDLGGRLHPAFKYLMERGMIIVEING